MRVFVPILLAALILFGAPKSAQALERELKLSAKSDVSALLLSGELFHGGGAGVGARFGLMDGLSLGLDGHFRHFSGLAIKGAQGGEHIFDSLRYTLSPGLHGEFGYPWTVTVFAGALFEAAHTKQQALLDSRGILMERLDDEVQMGLGCRGSIGVERRFFHVFTAGFVGSVEAPLWQSGQGVGRDEYLFSGQLQLAWHLYP